MQEVLTTLDRIEKNIEKDTKESIIFHVEMRASMSDIKVQLKEMDRTVLENKKDIQELKKYRDKHENRLNLLYITLVFMGFLILILYAQ